MVGDRRSGKLAVILHADVAGSSALVQQDERLAHERIQETFHRFGDIITQYHGRVRELRGDALLAEFERASDAVTAALALQSDQSKYNAQLNDDIQPSVRVGIAMGEVIIADNTVTGAGVVLAQRVEQLADPGGVVIQGAAYETIPGRFPFEYVDLGEHEVKGFNKPVRAYSANLKGDARIPPPDQTDHRFRDTLVAFVSVVVIATGIALMWFKPWEQREAPASVERMAFPLPDKPSIAVLPFTNMSDDAEQEYFVDGMTEDLITDLSQLSGLFVIARNSVFSYKGKPTKVRQVAEELGVRYVLEGSVRRAGDQIRINAQLIDATSGGHVWAKRYDGSIQDIFALQDRVSAQIVSALAMNLTTQESARIGRVQTEVPQAYDFFLRGMQHYRKATPDHYAEAVEYLLQAVELDPDFVHAHAALASVFFNSYLQKFYRKLRLEAFEAWGKMEQHLQQAMKAPTSLAFQVASGLSLTARHHGEAIDHANKAIALEPNDANAHTTHAFALLMAGKPEQALLSVDVARRLDPHNEYYYLFLQGLSEFGQEHYQNAMTAFEQALELNPELWSSDSEFGCALTPTVPLLSVYHYLGKKDAIQQLLQDEKYHCPINTTMLSWPYKESRDYDRLSNGLRGAGIPFL